MPDALDVFAEEVFAPLEMIYGAAAGEASGGALSFDHLDANAAKYARERGGELIGRNANAWSVEQTTRDEVRRLLSESVDYPDFKKRLDESGLFGPDRSEVIGRTEPAIAQNYGQSETYSEMGFSRVYVQDGDCDECREVDGKVASIAWIQENPVGHPNCVRSCSPAPDDEPIELE